jgi:hypothetical protein
MKNSLNPSLTKEGGNKEVLPLLRSRGDKRGVGVGQGGVVEIFDEK